MCEFILKVKNITDSLSAVACPVADSDIVYALLGGLSSDCATFVTLVNTRDDPTSLDELVGMLIS